MAEAPVRIVIAEDHALVRAGLLALLSQEPGIEVVGEAENGRDAVRAVAQHQPDVVLMDLTMPGMNGMEAISDIKRRFPAVRVLVLTLHKTEEFLLASLRAGADGYILKEATPAELRHAVRTVAGGGMFVSEELSGKLAAAPGAGAAGASGVWDTLTQREREVLKLVAEGKSNRGIAEFLFLSAKTVEKHRAKLMAKLGMRNAAALTAYAIERGLLVN